MAGQRHNGYEITNTIYSGKEEGSRGFGVTFLVERNMKQNVLNLRQSKNEYVG